MRYARMSASRNHVPGIGHQLRKVRLRKTRGAGGTDQRWRPKGAWRFFGKGAREFRGKGAREFWGKGAREFRGKGAREFWVKAPGSFGGRAHGSFGVSARWAPRWVCTNWTISQDRLPDLPIISIEYIRARYPYLSNTVKKFSEKNVKAPDNFILFYVLLQQCLFIF